jgi:cytoskeletal protein RodZ
MTMMRSRGAPQAGVVEAFAGDIGGDSAIVPEPEWVDVRAPAETLGQYLKRHRELRGINASELSRTTRISSGAIEALESDRFDELPGEVFVRGFLKAYAQAIGLLPAEVLARYTSSRRVVFVTPLPMQTPLQVARDEHGRRFGVAIAFVLLLILLSLALSIALRPRGRDMPSVLSQSSHTSALDTRTMTV